MAIIRLPFMITVFLFLARGHAAASSSDVSALVELTKGMRGFALQSWKVASVDSNGCPVNWDGIQCSGGLVTGINLANRNLTGEIKLGALGGMKMLSNLSFSNNKLSGKLDAQLHSLSSLQYFDISNNLFNGRIPSAIVALERLVYLNLSSNKLSEKIPDGLGKLRELRWIDLHSNQLSGIIDNGVMGLQNLEHIDFSDNQFSGTLSQMLSHESGLSQLQYLNLSNNQLVGSLLDYHSSSFANLRVLDVSNNQLSGKLPSFEFAYGLETLRLGGNKFSGNLPDALFVDDTLALKELDLSHNSLSGFMMNTITSKSLNILNLSSNLLSGPLPQKFGSCAVVDLSNNNLSGSLSLMWGNDLEMIDLSQNSFTGSLPNDTSTFLRLTYLNLSHNALVGPLPLVLGTYSRIRTIDLGFNLLNGPLLTNLFTSPTLAHLHLSRNNFTGRIPLQNVQPISPVTLLAVVNYSPLESLDLSNNQLNSFIPREIGDIDSLRSLNLAGNQFSGSIPREVSKLYALTNLNLCCNQLTGKIPNKLSANLKALNLSYNDLSGYVPENLRKFPYSSFYPGNVHLIFPSVSGSHGRGPEINGKGRHEKGLGADVKAIIIGVCTAGSALLVALALFLYYRRNSPTQHFSRYVDFGEKVDTKDRNRGQPSSAGYYEFHKDVDPSPPVPLKFSADNLLVPDKRLTSAVPKGLTTEAAVQETSDVKAKGLDSVKTSSTADISSSNNKKRSLPGSQSYLSSPPQSDDSFTSEHPVILNVQSPDRLAGDLFFLDNTLSFTAEELSRAPAEVLGRSSHGTSYKATLDNGHVLRVKWLREGLAKHRKEFAREAKKFANIRHPNLVSLRGYYWGQREHEKLILSDYMSAENLASHIYEKPGGKISPLDWTQRLKIAVDLARGLNYLHYEVCLSHGNLKATNVLLDGPDLNGKHADYSLHLLMTSAGTTEQILNAGALGYRAPELATAKKPKPSFKADVYAFGVILMEILTGKSAGDIISANSGVVDLTDWVRILATEGRAVDCFDRSLLSSDGDQEPPKGMDDMLAIALKCIRSASERPTIRTVFDDLTAIVV
ncbi:LRR receptor-like serine/threonine-protein kinase GHR1 [Cryptomeria japonica]|uniref:LRR receptor-like serine/threonine-protein kinase GHR1 n=1 Tax=Cryptomeria japonica TaxID=3369 RepID=UPI0025ABEA65|nr:LRR receptor-like serine/threonine-protein kinase GHR1 [Cryptomeria japonica]